MGGLGKSTMALAAAQMARTKGWRVWWVTATDTASLSGGMLGVLRQLHAPAAVAQAVQEGAPAAADHVWEFLNGPHRAGRRWLLIFDNADSPSVLAAPGKSSPADHTGWLRADPVGMVLVTTRNTDARVWGSGVVHRELAPLDDAAAAKILTDLAPAVPDPDGRQARDLGYRLGCLPLALHLAGSYLASPFARWHTFADYHRALDTVELPAALADLDDTATEARAAIQRTWDLSLDALAAGGQPQARPLLLLLCCYAPGTPIPPDLVQPHSFASMLTAIGQLPVADAEPQRVLRLGMHALANVGLIAASGTGNQARIAVTVHPVVADVNRARLQTTDVAMLPGIGAAAVQLLHQATAGLDGQRPADWRAWNDLTSHVLSALNWLAASLPATVLADLLDVSAAATDALIRSGNYAAAELLARAAIVASSPLGTDHPASVASRHGLAAAFEGHGRNPDSEQMFRDVLADQQRLLGEDHPDTLTTRFELAQVIGHRHDAEAERLYLQVLADQERILGADDPRTVATRHALALAISSQGRAEEAEQICRQVLTAQQGLLGDDHPDTLRTRYTITWQISQQGRDTEAEYQYRQILADQRRVLGDEHPQVLSTRRGLALTTARQGRHKEAEQMFRDVLAGHQRVSGEDHPSTLYTQLYLADAIAAQGRYAEAEQLYHETIAAEQRVFTDDHPMPLMTEYGLAQTIARQGRRDEAERLYRQVRTGQQQLLGEDHPSTLKTGRMLARAIADRGGYPEAEDLLQHLLTRQEQVRGKDHPETRATRQDLAELARLRDSQPPPTKSTPQRH